MTARIAPGDGELLVLQSGDFLTILWSGELRTAVCDRIVPGGAVIRDLTGAETAALAEAETRHLDERRGEAS